MVRKILARSAALLLVLPAIALAEPQAFVVDPGHSEVGFLVRHFVSKVHGRFDKFEGTLSVDPKDLSTMKFEGKVDVNSVNTNVAKRDDHLRSPDFFDVANNPSITFVSKKVTKNGDKWDVTGDFTMRGVTKDLTLTVEPTGFMEAFGGTRAGFEATGKVNRKDFGVSWNKVLDQGGTMLSDDVDLVLHIEAGTPRPAQPKPEVPKPEEAKK